MFGVVKPTELHNIQSPNQPTELEKVGLAKPVEGNWWGTSSRFT